MLVWHATWNNVEWYSLAREVEQDKSSGRLLTFWVVFNDSIINPDREVEMTWNLLNWNVDFLSFPTGTHGPSDLSGIKSYGCFFWWSELVVRTRLVRSGGPIWLSDLIWSDLAVRFGYPIWSFSSCEHLSNINVEFLGSIIFSCILKLVSAKNEVTSFRSSFTRLRIIGPS